MNRISKLRSRVLLKQPFFGTILMTAPLVETESIPTAATDMRAIFYNPSFFDQLTDGQVIFVLAHEVLHIAFKHGLRVQSRDRRLWNVAADYAINWILAEQGFEFPPSGLLEPSYADMSAEHIYEQLLRDAEQKPQPSSGDGNEGQPGDNGDDGGGGGQPGDQNDDGSEDAGGMGRDLLPIDGLSPAEKAKLDQTITQQVAQAANMARMAGKLHGSLERAVTAILNPEAPIEEILRQFMTETERDDESWSCRNRRFQDVYLPARHNEAMGEVVMIGDTSGSVSERDLNLIAGMVTRISENMRPERVRMVWADTEVAGEQVFERGDALDFKPVGGSGTDMRVPLEHVEQHDPVVTVMVTDGRTPWPQAEPGYPLIVCCTTEVDVPIGQVVRI